MLFFRGFQTYSNILPLRTSQKLLCVVPGNSGRQRVCDRLLDILHVTALRESTVVASQTKANFAEAGPCLACCSRRSVAARGQRSLKQSLLVSKLLTNSSGLTRNVLSQEASAEAVLPTRAARRSFWDHLGTYEALVRELTPEAQLLLKWEHSKLALLACSEGRGKCFRQQLRLVLLQPQPLPEIGRYDLRFLTLVRVLRLRLLVAETARDALQAQIAALTLRSQKSSDSCSELVNEPILWLWLL